MAEEGDGVPTRTERKSARHDHSDGRDRVPKVKKGELGSGGRNRVRQGGVPNADEMDVGLAGEAATEGHREELSALLALLVLARRLDEPLVGRLVDGLREVGRLLVAGHQDAALRTRKNTVAQGMPVSAETH